MTFLKFLLSTVVVLIPGLFEGLEMATFCWVLVLVTLLQSLHTLEK